MVFKIEEKHNTQHQLRHLPKISPSLVRVGQMLLQVLGHTKALLTLLAKDGLHGLVRSEPLAVLLILRIWNT